MPRLEKAVLLSQRCEPRVEEQGHQASVELAPEPALQEGLHLVPVLEALTGLEVDDTWLTYVEDVSERPLDFPRAPPA